MYFLKFIHIAKNQNKRNLENKNQEEESEKNELNEELSPISDLVVFNLIKTMEESMRQERLKKK